MPASAGEIFLSTVEQGHNQVFVGRCALSACSSGMVVPSEASARRPHITIAGVALRLLKRLQGLHLSFCVLVSLDA